MFVSSLFKAMASAADGESLAVEQFANASNQKDFMVLVIAAIATPFHRFELRKFLFPIAKHMRLDAT